MTDSAIPAMPYDNGDDEPQPEASSKETTPGGKKEVKWKVVAEAPGITPASIIAGRLKEEGIPVRAWQEGAGQALGLTVGLLGTGYVAVPEEFEEKAISILEEDVEDFDDWQDEGEE